MEIEEIFAQIDRYLENGQPQEAENYMLAQLSLGRQKQDWGLCLQIYNELIGYYRATSNKEELVKSIDAALALSEKMGLSGSISYATTALNAANAYRSIGELDRSKALYEQTRKIYEKKLAGDDALFAGLYNNMSLLYQEMNDYETALDYLKKALAIVTKLDARFEIAVTYANLANTCVLAKDFAGVKEYAKKSMECFDAMNYYDAHYAANLSALGLCRMQEQNYEEAAKLFEKGMDIVEKTLGKNSQYARLQENLTECRKYLEAGQGKKDMEPIQQGERKKGMDICREYYQEIVRPMLQTKFSDYVGQIAVGLVGEGSDCFGFDDEISRDHDWGPDCCLWLTDELYEQIGEELIKDYDALPKEFKGYHRTGSEQGKGRRGVLRISDFYQRILGTSDLVQLDYGSVPDYALACACNGEVFVDELGEFSRIRRKLQEGYPQNVLYLRIAQAAATFSQNGQYNYQRMMERGEKMSADGMLFEAIRQAQILWHYIRGTYPVHDKWLTASTGKLPGGEELLRYLHKVYQLINTDESGVGRTVVVMEQLGDFLARELYAQGFISDIDSYLDHHTDELVKKSSIAMMDHDTLVNTICRMEFEAFDQVKNEGGRASCQNDWPTFYVMRKSQYLSWNQMMLMQYHYDFNREMAIGHNLITEKYGRMMESTAPERYQEIKDNFPEISDTKRAVIEQIVSIQMQMVEVFAAEYPNVVSNARNLHTSEDSMWDTSYETYLRGEISTYSDKMLQLYGQYVVQCAASGTNIARMTIENTARLYGFKDLDDFAKHA